MDLELETEGTDDGMYFRLQGCIASTILGKTKAERLTRRYFARSVFVHIVFIASVRAFSQVIYISFVL
jgi:hypothetical protein